MDAASGLPVFGAGQVHARAENVLHRTARIGQRGRDQRKALFGLGRSIGIIRPDRPVPETWKC